MPLSCKLVKTDGTRSVCKKLRYLLEAHPSLLEVLVRGVRHCPSLATGAATAGRPSRLSRTALTGERKEQGGWELRPTDHAVPGDRARFSGGTAGRHPAAVGHPDGAGTSAPGIGSDVDRFPIVTLMWRSTMPMLDVTSRRAPFLSRPNSPVAIFACDEACLCSRDHPLCGSRTRTATKPACSVADRGCCLRPTDRSSRRPAGPD